MTIDNHLRFESHIESFCVVKLAKKLYALPRMSSYVSFDQRGLIMKSFINPFMTEAIITWKPVHRFAPQWTSFYMITASFMKGLTPSLVTAD